DSTPRRASEPRELGTRRSRAKRRSTQRGRANEYDRDLRVPSSRGSLARRGVETPPPLVAVRARRPDLQRAVADGLVLGLVADHDFVATSSRVERNGECG